MSFLDEYYGNYGGLSSAAYVDRYIRGSAIQMERIRATAMLLAKEDRTVLDVGAGHGVLLEEIEAAHGIKGVGIEITQSKVDYARSRGIDLRLGRAETLEFDDRSFDAVISCEVLEHLPYGAYEKALTEMARVARRAVIVSVPNEEVRPFVRCPYCGASVNPNYHFRTFSSASIAGLIPGFTLERTIFLGSHRSSPLLTLGRRMLDSAWPPLLVCASCGYRTPRAPVVTPGEEPQPRPLRDAAQRLSTFLPARRKSTWLVGVFVAPRDVATRSAGSSG